MASELARIAHLKFFIDTIVYKSLGIFFICCSILFGVFLFAVPCFAAETEEIQEESYDIPGSTFYVPKSMFQTTEAYEDYCIHMYELGYMNGQFEWTDAAQAFIDDPQNIDIAEALEEDRQRILSEREQEDSDGQSSIQEPAVPQTERLSEDMEVSDPSIHMTEALEAEEQSEEFKEEKSSNISFGAMLLIIIIVFMAGSFYFKNRKK